MYSSYCFLYEETIKHLFCECNVTLSVYLQIKYILETNNVFLPDCTASDILLGLLLPGPKNCLINHLILIYKYMVYAKRNNDRDCNVSTFINLVKQTENIEKRITKKRNKYHYHIKKWEPLLLTVCK